MCRPYTVQAQHLRASYSGPPDAVPHPTLRQGLRFDLVHVRFMGHGTNWMSDLDLDACSLHGARYTLHVRFRS